MDRDMRTRMSPPPVQEARAMSYKYNVIRCAAFATFLVTIALLALR